MQTRVSIVTPIFNAASFLSEAIESVLQQDFGCWELILVDDGSTDGSGTLAESWCRRDSRLRLLRHPLNRNKGSSASRNLAIAQSRGELIAMLDADDAWLPGKLRFQVDVLDAHPEAALTFGAAERWLSWNRSASPSDDYIVRAFGENSLIHPPELVDAFVRDESLTPCTCAVLFRRDSIDASGPFEASFPGLYDDQVFLAKICSTWPVFATAGCVARYRKHVDSCCARAVRDGSETRERDRFLSWLAAYKSSCVSLS